MIQEATEREKRLLVRGHYGWRHWSAPRKSGLRTLLGEGGMDNLIVTTGLNLILNSGLGTLYMGLINASPTPSIVAGDTMASHAGWAETHTTYNEATRPQWSYSVTNGVASAANVNFNFTGTVTVHGLFMTSNNTKGGTTGTLLSAAAFSQGNRSFQNGQFLQGSFTLTLTRVQ